MGQSDVLVRLLPFQLFENGDDVYLRRGNLQVALEGEGVASVVARLQELATDQYLTRSDVLSHFPPVLHDRVDAIIRHLISRRMAELRGGEAPPTPSAKETGEDIFFWQIGLSRDDIARDTDRPIAIIGINRLSLALRDSLNEFGSWTVRLIDDVPLRNHALVETSPELRSEAVEADDFEAAIRDAALVVGCAEFGGLSLLMPWNAHCVERRIPFLPVILQDPSIQIGPLAVADESACMACLESRENAVLREKAPERRLMDSILPDGQDVASAHPAVLKIAANLGAFEVLRFCANIYPLRVGKRIEFNLMASSMVASRVLKAPRCPVCSPLRHAGALNLAKPELDPAKWAKVEAMGGGDDGY